jgi:hypothetical protein
VLHISKRPKPVNLVHCPSCNRHEPFCYSCRHRPTPKNTSRGNPGCAVGPQTPTDTSCFCASLALVPPRRNSRLRVPRHAPTPKSLHHRLLPTLLVSAHARRAIDDGYLGLRPHVCGQAEIWICSHLLRHSAGSAQQKKNKQLAVE